MEPTKNGNCLPMIVNQSVIKVGSEGIHVSALENNKSTTDLLHGYTSLHNMFLQSVNSAGDYPCLGQRSSPSAPYKWMTYNDILCSVKNFGSGLINLSCWQDYQDKVVGIYTRSCSEWVISALACLSYGLIYASISEAHHIDVIEEICRKVELTVIICDTIDRAKKIIMIKPLLKYLKHLIVVEYINEPDALTDMTNNLLQIHQFGEIITAGKNLQQEFKPLGYEDIITICFTSGTTDCPKGVLLSNRMFLSAINGIIQAFGAHFFVKETIYMTLESFGIVHQQVALFVIIFAKAKIGFHSGLKTFLKDAKELKPNVISFDPFNLKRIYDKAYWRISKLKIPRFLVNSVLKCQGDILEKKDYNKLTIWNRLIFGDICKKYGNNLKVIFVGGAHSLPEVLRFCRTALSCVIINGYGCSESCGAVAFSINADLEGVHVGSPIPDVEIKLTDIPELDILVSRDGKGEICIKSKLCTTGYYKDPENTKQLYDEDGWLHTGDIGLWTAENCLKVVDRCKNVFKLSRGVYVFPEYVESIYQRSQLVFQAFVDGNASQPFPIGIVIPEFETVMSVLNRRLENEATLNESEFKKLEIIYKGSDKSDEYLITPAELCIRPDVIKMVYDDLYHIGKLYGLKNYQQIKKLFLFPEPFTVENKMLTSSGKLARYAIRHRFINVLHDLHVNTKKNDC